MKNAKNNTNIDDSTTAIADNTAANAAEETTTMTDITNATGTPVNTIDEVIEAGAAEVAEATAGVPAEPEVTEEGAVATPALVAAPEIPLPELSADRQTEISSILGQALADVQTITERRLSEYESIKTEFNKLKFFVMELGAKGKAPKEPKEKKTKTPKEPKADGKIYHMALENVARLFAIVDPADQTTTPGTFTYKQRDEEKTFVVIDGDHEFKTWADVYYLSSSLVKEIKAKGIKLVGDYQTALWMGVGVDANGNKFAVSVTGEAPTKKEKKAKTADKTTPATLAAEPVVATEEVVNE